MPKFVGHFREGYLKTDTLFNIHIKIIMFKVANLRGLVEILGHKPQSLIA